MELKYTKYIDYNELDKYYSKSLSRNSLIETIKKDKHGNAMSKMTWEQIKRNVLRDCNAVSAHNNKIGMAKEEYIIEKMEKEFLDKIEWIPDGCYYNTYFNDEELKPAPLITIPKSIWGSIPIYIFLMLFVSIFNEAATAWVATTIFYICWIIVEIKKFN